MTTMTLLVNLAKLRDSEGNPLPKNTIKKSNEKTKYRIIDGLEEKVAQAKAYMLDMEKEGIVEPMIVRVAFGTSAVNRKVWYIKDMSEKEKVEEWKTVGEDE